MPNGIQLFCSKKRRETLSSAQSHSILFERKRNLLKVYWKQYRETFHDFIIKYDMNSGTSLDMVLPINLWRIIFINPRQRLITLMKGYQAPDLVHLSCHAQLLSGAPKFLQRSGANLLRDWPLSASSVPIKDPSRISQT